MHSLDKATVRYGYCELIQRRWSWKGTEHPTYPPGYLDEVEDEDKPSGITIFGDGDAPKAEHEEGGLPEAGSLSPAPRRRMTVEFPGINAPVPENGDPWLWGSTPPPQSSSGCHHHHHPSSDSRDRVGGPPGAEHYSSSSRHHPYDHGVVATPGLVRSHSDRGQRSLYGNPPPPPGEEGSWTPHASYSSRQHSSGSELHSRDRDRERPSWHDRHYYNSSSRR